MIEKTLCSVPFLMLIVLTDGLQSYNAKLSDFGLARDGPNDEESHVSTRVMGTDGYAAPEYLDTGKLN